MFGSKEMVTWIFSVVAANTVGKAEAKIALANVGKAAPRPGASGIDRKNKAVYWDDAVAWSGLKTSDTQGKISTLAFRQLLYNIHPPTSAMVTTVKVAIARAEKRVCARAAPAWARRSPARRSRSPARRARGARLRAARC